MAKNKKIETEIEFKYNDTRMKKFEKDLKDVENQTQGTDKAVQIWAMDLKKLDDTLNKINATLEKFNKKKPKPPIPETNKFTEALLTLKKMAQGLLALEVVKWFYGIGKAAIKASSDIEELDNVTTQVFEHLKNEVDVWAKTMASAVGRSTYQITKQTTDMGNILKGFGDYFSVDEISKMSKNLSVLATDMASFLNIEDERASQSITAALTGEAESLKRLGFNLQDLTIKEYALAKGIKKKYEEMTQAEKVQLRYEKLLEITKHVQGDAARTIDNYANQVKSLEANWNNFLTTIGSKLKPSTKAFISFTSQLLNATNELLNHKDALTIVGEYKAQEISIDNLVRKWQALENELKTLSQTSEKYKTKLNEQKIIESKLIEISPSFINVFKDKATAVKKIGDAAQYAKNQLNNLLLKELEQEIVLKPAMKRMLKYTKIVKGQIEDDALINKTTEVLKRQHGIDPKTFFKKYSLADLAQNDSSVSAEARRLLIDYSLAYDRRIKKEFEKDKKLKAIEKANEKDNKVFEEIKRTQNIKEIEEINPIVEKVNKNNNLLSKEAKKSTKKIKTYWESFKEKLENEFIEYEKALGSLDTKSFNSNKQAITKYINSLYENKKKINEFLFEKEVIKEDELLKENEKALTSKIEALKQVYQKSKDDKDRLILTTAQGELEALKVQKIELEHRNKLKELDNLSLNNLITEEEYKRKIIEVDKNKVQKLIEINELSLAAQANFELSKKELENYLKKVENKEDNSQQNELLQGLADAFNLNSLKKINELHFKFLKEKDEALKKVYEVYKGNLGYTSDYSKLSSNDKKEFETKFIQSGANSKEYQSAISRINNNTQKELVGAYSGLAKEISGNLTKMIGGIGRSLADVTGDKDIIALADGIGEAVGNITAIGAGAARIAVGDIAGGVKDVVQGGIGAISQLAKVIISITKEGQAKLEKEAKEKFLKRENELIENTKTLKELKNTMRELINSNLILASKNTSNLNIEKEKRKLDIIKGAYSKTFDPKLIANTVEVKRGKLFNLKWGGETIEHSIKLKEFLKKLNPGKELNFGSNSKELLDFYEKNIGSLTEKDLKVLQKNKDGVFNWETESVNSNLEELKTEFLKHIDNVREFENNIKEFEKKAIFESLDGVSHLDKEKENKEMLDNIKNFINNDAEYYKLLPEYEKKIDELLSINKPIVTALNETREAFITNLSQGKDILSGFGNSLLGYFNLIRKNIAKIKYDLEFRNFGDFEKNFNERFLQLSQALVKLRTEKGKTLKDLDPKELDFSDIFKQIKAIKDSSNDMQGIIKELRSQAKSQGLSEEMIDQMLPLDKISDKVNKISTMLANAMNLAIDTNSFNQFSMSIGDSLYKTVKENLIKAFSESAKFKELYEKFINTEDYNSALNKAKSLNDAYGILTSKLKEFENKLKGEGLGFRETNASNGEYLGGVTSHYKQEIARNGLIQSSGATVTVNNYIDNKGFLSTTDLTNSMTEIIKEKLNNTKKREV